MRTLALALLLASTAGVALADPVPRVNIALAHDGLEVAATTTLADGGATLQALHDGEYGLVQQSTLPVESRLTALVRQEVFSVDLPAGVPPRGVVLAFAARAGDTIELCLETLEGAAPLPDAQEFPTLCAVESTGDAGHGDLPVDLPVSDIDPTLPAPEAPVTDAPDTPDIR
jgi:hypothetical protein